MSVHKYSFEHSSFETLSSVLATMYIHSKYLLFIHFKWYFQIFNFILFLLVNDIYSRDLASSEFIMTNPLADEEALEIMELIAEEEDFQRTLHEENSDELFTANEKG